MCLLPTPTAGVVCSTFGSGERYLLGERWQGCLLHSRKRPVSGPDRGHFHSFKFPNCLILIVEIAYHVCSVGTERYRDFIDEIALCFVTFTGLDVSDSSAPPDLVIELRPRNFINNHIGTMDWRIIVERPVPVHHKLFC